MNEALFKKIVDQWSGTSYLVRLHNLGEPLLDKRMVHLIDYAASRGVRVEISTNCTALSEERGRELLQSKLTQIICSIDGASKETYEHIRKNADFDRVVGHLHTFFRQKHELKSRVRVVLQIILMNETVGEVDRFIEQWDPERRHCGRNPHQAVQHVGEPGGEDRRAGQSGSSVLPRQGSAAGPVPVFMGIRCDSPGWARCPLLF